MSQLPWSEDAEEGTLGACLLTGQEAVGGCVQRGLKTEDFFNHHNQIIWETLSGLYERRAAIDEITVASALQAMAQLTEIGGLPRLNQLTNRVETSANLSAHCRIVLDRSLQRKLWRLTAKTLEEMVKPSVNFADLTSRVQPILTELGELSLVEKGTSLKDVAKSLVDEAEATARGEVTPQSTHGLVETPWTWFNQNYMPFSPLTDGLVVFAGRPGTGKSAIMRNIMGHAVLTQNYVTVGFLLEMTREQWLKAMASEIAQVNLRELQQVPKDRLAQYVTAHQRLAKMADEQLFLFDQEMTIEAIEARCRFIKQREGDIGLVVIDYLQLVEKSEKTGWQPRETVVAEISRRLKKLQKEIDCVFLVGSQINRESERGDREPKLADMRESGAIEQDAERVILLYRPKVDHSGNAQMESRAESEVFLIQAKNRHGPKRHDRFIFRQVTTTFFEYTGSKKVSPRPQGRRTQKAFDASM